MLREAGEGAAQRAPASAAHWFEAALGLLPAPRPPSERVELLMALAGAKAATGRFEEARAALLESIELRPATEALRITSSVPAPESSSCSATTARRMTG